MTQKRGWKAYVAVFAAIAFVSAIATSVTVMMFQNFGCRTPHDPDDFLAYCRSLGYVDYEHGALYYGLEPKVRDSIRTAQVLFLGSSRVQAAFAANALREYFKARGIRYFVMGFGYGEASAFGQPVMERSRASPKVIVINADPFFVEPNILSEPAKDAINGGAGYLWRLMSKMAFQRIHRIICRTVPVCPENEPSIFRSAVDGQWNWVGPYMEEREVPIGQEFKERLPEYQIEQAKILGNVSQPHRTRSTMRRVNWHSEYRLEFHRGCASSGDSTTYPVYRAEDRGSKHPWWGTFELAKRRALVGSLR